jgi:hypothetical protein
MACRDFLAVTKRRKALGQIRDTASAVLHQLFDANCAVPLRVIGMGDPLHPLSVVMKGADLR